MNTQEKITEYINSLSEAKRSEMKALHQLILKGKPSCRLWFFDGKNSDNKVVANPNIGYGIHSMEYANGDKRDWFQIGISANTTGISVYILGIKDKKYLSQAFGEKLGKAKVTGYCIKFKTLKDMDIEVLEDVIRFGFENK